MATDLPDIEIIDRYLNGELAEQERLQFEAEMEGNAELQSAVEEHMKSLAIAKELGKAQWKEQMSSRFVEDAPVVRGLSRRMIYALAACVLALLIIGGLWFVQNKNELSPEKWMALQVEVPPAPEIKSTDQDLQLAEAYLAYNQTQYQEALDKMSILENEVDGSRKVELSFFKGMSLFYLNQYPEAQQNFGKITSGPYVEMAEWYKALSLVKEDRKLDALRALALIEDQGGFYKAKAAELIQLLE